MVLWVSQCNHLCSSPWTTKKARTASLAVEGLPVTSFTGDITKNLCWEAVMVDMRKKENRRGQTGGFWEDRKHLRPTVAITQSVHAENLLLSTCWWHGALLCNSLCQLAFLSFGKFFLNKELQHAAMQAKTFCSENKIKTWAGIHSSRLDEAKARRRQFGEGWVLSSTSELHPGLSCWPVEFLHA